jgi:hypothetical protein
LWREAKKRLALTPKHRRCPWAIKLQFLRSFELSTEPCCISRLRETNADIFGANGHGFQMNPALPEDLPEGDGRKFRNEMRSAVRRVE